MSVLFRGHTELIVGFNTFLPPGFKIEVNGDRISMSNTMSLLFEVRDLAVASPATVSRAGMVYLDVVDLGFQPFVDSWLARMFGSSPDDMELFTSLFAKYRPPLQRLPPPPAPP